MPWVNLGVIFGKIGAPWAPSKSEIAVQDAMDRVSMDLEKNFQSKSIVVEYASGRIVGD